MNKPISVTDKKGVVYQAIQYGGGRHADVWRSDMITEIAVFVLGLKSDSSIAMENERMLDVVRPSSNWRVGEWSISLWDNNTEDIWCVNFGDWVLKEADTGALLAVSDAEFGQYFEVCDVTQSPEFTPNEEVIVNELAETILQAFGPMEGEFTTAIARRAAWILMNNGWRKS